MTDDDDIFAVVYGTAKTPSIEELRAFEWDEIVKQIYEGKYTSKISWVMKNHDIPKKYNSHELEAKVLENYKEFIENALDEIGYVPPVRPNPL